MQGVNKQAHPSSITQVNKPNINNQATLNINKNKNNINQPNNNKLQNKNSNAQQQNNDDYGDEYDEGEEEEDEDEYQSTVNNTRGQFNKNDNKQNQQQLKRDQTTGPAMKTLNQDGASIFDNTQNTFHGLSPQKSQNKPPQDNNSNKQSKAAVQKQQSQNAAANQYNYTQKSQINKNQTYNGGEDGEEQYDEEMEEEEEYEDESQMMKTEGQFSDFKNSSAGQLSKQNLPIGLKAIAHQQQLNRNKPIDPAMLGRDPQQNYLLDLKNRREGIPIKASVPTMIEPHHNGQNVNNKITKNPLYGVSDGTFDEKQIIPSFLPGKQNDGKPAVDQTNYDHHRVAKQRKQIYDAKMNKLVVNRNRNTQQDPNISYYDPFEAHLTRLMDDKLKNQGGNDVTVPAENAKIADSYYSQAIIGAYNMKSPLNTSYQKYKQNSTLSIFEEDPFATAPDKINRNRNSKGFHSVQRVRNQADTGEIHDDNVHIVQPIKTSFPNIKTQISHMEKNMEKELDREAKLKKDAKRLIVHAVGKNNGELDRTVKAWLKKDSEPSYINEGQPYTKQYRQLIEKEIIEGRKDFPAMDKFMKKGLFNQAEVHKGLQSIKDKYQKEQEIQQQQFLKIKAGLPFDYNKIKDVYNVPLLESSAANTEAYLDKKKTDAMNTIRHVFKKKFEEKMIFQQLSDSKIIKRERVSLEEKLRMVGIAVELAKQRLEWLLYDTPYTIGELEQEVRDNKASGNAQLPQIVKDFKLDQSVLAEIQKQSRMARSILQIQVIEARALKNRTGCDSISDFVLLYREFKHIERGDDMIVLLNDALLNKQKAQDCFNFIEKIVNYEDEILRVRGQFNTMNFEAERAVEGDKFYNYDEVVLKQVNEEDKDQFLKMLQYNKIIFQFIPFWYVPITKSDTSVNANHLRSMLKLDIFQAQKLADYLKCTTIDDIVTFFRHNRKKKEFILFEKEELSFLQREQNVPEETSKEFANLILMLSREILMVPEQMFNLAKPSLIQEIDFSNYKAEHLTSDAIATIMACISMHQPHVSKLVFVNSQLNPKSAVIFKIVLADENIPIISCNFDENQLGDQGIDHIVQAIKNNPTGDMRILRLSNNQLSIQASIRLAHVLKKRPTNMVPLNLQILKLSNNQIGNIGTETLGTFIKKNDTLKYLDISFNKIDDRGLLAISDCFQSNQKLQVLNMLGNEFTSKSLQPFGQSLIDNKLLKLLILKIGTIKTDQQSFINFINSGFMTSANVRYMYVTTPHFKNPAVKAMNDSFLPKVLYATENHNPIIDSCVLLDFMTRIVEDGLTVDGKVNNDILLKYGEQLLMNDIILTEKFKLNTIEILIYLFENIFGPDHILVDQQLAAFHLFAKHGLIEPLVYCIKMGISPNFKTSISYRNYPSATALHIAAGYNQLDLCLQLIKFGVEIDNKDLNGNTALHYSAIQGSQVLARLLIDNKASCTLPNKENMLPMHSCIFSDNVECFKYILAETEKQKRQQYYGRFTEKVIDTRTYNQLTPLMVSLDENAQNVFEYLLENGIDLKAQDEDGQTILHRAILKKDEKKCKQLIKQGCDIHTKSFNGDSPLMMAVKNGLMDVVIVLTKQGADLQEKNHRGDSLLHLAARVDKADIIGFLLDKGMSTQERNRDQQRPCDLAKRPAMKSMLSQPQNNQRLDMVKNQAKGIKKGQYNPASVAAENNNENWENYNQLAEENKSKLLNEALIKYKNDKQETIGNDYVNRFNQFNTSKISQMSAELGRKNKQQHQAPQMSHYGPQTVTANNKNIFGSQNEEEDDEDEQAEEEEYEDEAGETALNTHASMLTTQTRAQKLRELTKNNYDGAAQANNTAQQSAGFRGTVDVKRPVQQTQNIKPDLQKQQSQLPQQLKNNQNKNLAKSIKDETNQNEEEYGDEGDEEEDYEDEEGEDGTMRKTLSNKGNNKQNNAPKPQTNIIQQNNNKNNTIANLKK